MSTFQQNNSNNIISNSIISINIDTQRPSSPTSSTGPTLSEPKVKRRRLINYLSGEGQKYWGEGENLIVNDMNVTRILKKFRSRNIMEAEEKALLNDVRVLSLSFIFPVCDNSSSTGDNRCITRYFSKQVSNALNDCAQGAKEATKKAKASAIMYCKAIADEDEVEDEGEDEDQDSMTKAIKSLAKQLKNNQANVPYGSETSFMDKYLKPIWTQMLTSGLDKSFIYSTTDGSHYGIKPDFMIGVVQRKNPLYFFFVEVKRPAETSCYQEESDFVKLLKEMKHSINDQLVLGFNDPISYGLLVEGFRCSLFKMFLASEGIYMSVLLKRFLLVEETNDMINLPSVVEAFDFVKEKLMVLKDDLEVPRNKKQKKQQGKKARPSFKTKFVK